MTSPYATEILCLPAIWSYSVQLPVYKLFQESCREGEEKETSVSAVPVYNGQQSASLSTCVVPMPDEHLLQPHPFTSEDEYWQLILARLEARHWFQHLRAARATLLTTALGHDARAALSALHEHQTALATQDAHLLQGYRTRVAFTPPHSPAPRLLRLAARLHLTEVECDIVHSLVLMGCEGAFSGATADTCDVGNVADILGLDPHDFFAFLDPTKPLLRYDVIQIDSRPLEAPRRRAVSMDVALLKALRGAPLTEEDLCTLSASPLHDVLLEEPTLTLPAALSDTLDTPPEPDSEPSCPSAVSQDTPAVQSCGSSTGFIASTDLGHAEEQTPYTSDLTYLQDHLAWFKARHRWKAVLEEHEEASSYDRYADNLTSRLREAQTQERVWRHRIERRLQQTHATATCLPRAEQLATRRQLTAFEKHVLLFLAGVTISSAFQRTVRSQGGGMEVGALLHLFWDTLEAQITARRSFYREAPLLQDALIDLHSTRVTNELLHSDARIDRRMVDYLVGLETESTALVEGSHLYRPTVDLDRVVLPEIQKRLIVETVTGFPAFQRARRRYVDHLMEYGRGLVLLFWGPSGTGKTVMANALASSLGQRLLLVNYPRIGQMTSDQVLKFLFREAKIHDAVLFFDECDSIFESRERHNAEISLILSEIERYDGLIIMATNRPTVLDEAMHRRITLAVEFRLPDAAQRAQIWRVHLPPDLPIEGPLDLTELAYRHELSGGLIKNAVLAALALATARDPETPCLRPEDVEQGARLQIRSQLRMAAFEACTIPQSGLEHLIVPLAIRQALHDLIGLARVRRTLINEWGFTDATERSSGATALLYGPPGTGKSLAAEAVAYELGRPLRRVNAAQVTSKWVGETAQNLESIFREARQHEAVLVFEEADALFSGRTPVGSATDRYANLDTAVLLREMERFPGVVILTSNLSDNIDEAFRRRLRFALAFPTPEREAREALWRRHLPARMPLAPDVSCATLAAFPLTGAQIRNAVLKAAARAALRQEAQRRVSQHDLTAAAEEEGWANGAPRIMGFTGNHDVY